MTTALPAQLPWRGTWPGRERCTPPRALVTLALVLLIVDGALLAGNLAFLTVDEPDRESTHPVFSNLAWNGDNDASYPELWGQLQSLAASILLIVMFRRTGARIYAAWALVFACVIADDLLRLHEAGGEALVGTGWTPPAGGLGAQDIGELIVWAALGLILGALLVQAHVRAPHAARRDSLVLLALLLFIAVFAVGVDMVKVLVAGDASSFVVTLLALIETNGELAGMSLVLCAVAWMTMSPDARGVSGSSRAGIPTRSPARGRSRSRRSPS